jgi:hypothetical protein
MQGVVGAEVPFDHSCTQMMVLADWEGTTKSVERTAEAIGADIAQSEEDEIRKIVRLDLPIIVGEPVPILYVQTDGTGLPVVNKQTEGRKGKADGHPEHTLETKLGCVFTKPQGTRKATPLATRIRPLSREPSRPPKSSASL